MAAVFERAKNPRDAAELCALYIGKAESALGRSAVRPELAELWCTSAKKRTVYPDALLRDPALAELTRRLFNFYFQQDLYCRLKSEDTIILSSGSFDESEFGLPRVLKHCIDWAIGRNWHGYSHSTGREQTREALAELETVRSGGSINYGPNGSL